MLIGRLFNILFYSACKHASLCVCPFTMHHISFRASQTFHSLSKSQEQKKGLFVFRSFDNIPTFDPHLCQTSAFRTCCVSVAPACCLGNTHIHTYFRSGLRTRPGCGIFFLSLTCNLISMPEGQWRAACFVMIFYSRIIICTILKVFQRVFSISCVLFYIMWLSSDLCLLVKNPKETSLMGLWKHLSEDHWQLQSSVLLDDMHVYVSGIFPAAFWLAGGTELILSSEDDHPTQTQVWLKGWIRGKGGIDEK